jgi:hypothetical protein
MIEFADFEDQLVELEQLIVDSWPTLERNTARTRRLTASNLHQQTEIETMAMRATRMRMAYVQLLSIIEVPTDGPDGRRFLERAIQADAIDRLKMLDDTIELYEEFYRSEREQFSEYRYYHTEIMLMAWILLALVVQLMFPNQSVVAVVGRWIVVVAYPMVTGFIGGL